MKPAWLSDAVLYQIYPQSFQDTNGDGIGDFQGIIKRLDYIRSIGVNTLWLNPCFDSPFGDAGYDVRDFYKVAPRYGTEADLVQLFEEAHLRGMHVILDLVAGHTSMDNEWFKAEAADPKNPNSNRYIWKNRDFDPSKGPDKEDFVANFFWYQPALNYGYVNPTEPWQDPMDAPGPMKNRQEMKDIIDYWLSRGCDGFRVDMAASLIKFGPDDGEARLEAMHAFWQEMRQWQESKYPESVLVAEWSNPAQAIAAGFHLDFMMHFNAPGYPSLFFNGVGAIPDKEGPCYFDADGQGDPHFFMTEYKRHLDAMDGKGYVSLPTANHDFQRPRCGKRGWEGLRPVWVFLMTQAGLPTIYYGDEIGMRYDETTPAKEGSTLTGILPANAGAANGERSGTRTPMQWDSTKNDGFSIADADQLYLPVDADPDRPNVEKQENDSGSILNFARKLLKIRSEHRSLGADASYRYVDVDGAAYPLVIERQSENERCLIVVNPSRESLTVIVPVATTQAKTILTGGCGLWFQDTGVKVTVSAFGYGIFLLD